MSSIEREMEAERGSETELAERKSETAIGEETKATPQQPKPKHPASYYQDQKGNFDFSRIPIIWRAPENPESNDISKAEMTKIEQEAQKIFENLGVPKSKSYEQILRREQTKFLAERARRDCLNLFLANPYNSKLVYYYFESRLAFAFTGSLDSSDEHYTSPGIFLCLGDFFLNLSKSGEQSYRYALYYIDIKNKRCVLFAQEDREEINIGQSSHVSRIDVTVALPLAPHYFPSSGFKLATSLLKKEIDPDSISIMGQNHDYTIKVPELREYYAECERLRNSLTCCILNPQEKRTLMMMGFVQHTGSDYGNILQPPSYYLDPHGYFNIEGIPVIWEAPDNIKRNDELTKRELREIKQKANLSFAELLQPHNISYEKILWEVRVKFLAERATAESFKLFCEKKKNIELLFGNHNYAFALGESTNHLGRNSFIGPGTTYCMGNFLLNVSKSGGGSFRFFLYFINKELKKCILFACEDRAEINIKPSSTSKKSTNKVDYIVSLPISPRYLASSTGFLVGYSLLTKELKPDSKRRYKDEYFLSDPELRDYYTRCEFLRNALADCMLHPEKDPGTIILAFIKHTGSNYTNNLANMLTTGKYEFWLSPNIAGRLFRRIIKEYPVEALLLKGKHNRGRVPKALNIAIQILKEKNIIKYMRFQNFFISYDEVMIKTRSNNGFIINLPLNELHSLQAFLKFDIKFYPAGELEEGLKKFKAIIKDYHDFSLVDPLLGRNQKHWAEINEKKQAYIMEPKEVAPFPDEHDSPIEMKSHSESSNSSLSSSSNSSSGFSSSNLSSSSSSSAIDTQASPSIEVNDKKNQVENHYQNMSSASSSSSSASYTMSIRTLKKRKSRGDPIKESKREPQELQKKEKKLNKSYLPVETQREEKKLSTFSSSSPNSLSDEFMFSSQKEESIDLDKKTSEVALNKDQSFMFFDSYSPQTIKLEDPEEIKRFREIEMLRRGMRQTAIDNILQTADQTKVITSGKFKEQEDDSFMESSSATEKTDEQDEESTRIRMKG